VAKVLSELQEAMDKLVKLLEETITVPSEDQDAKWLMDSILESAIKADVVQLLWFRRQHEDFARCISFLLN
jgi:hypothetical protein